MIARLSVRTHPKLGNYGSVGKRVRAIAPLEVRKGDDDAPEIRQALTAARSANGWSRATAAERAGVHRNTVLRWETEDAQWEPRINYLKALLHAESGVSGEIVLRLLDLEGDMREQLDVDPAFLELAEAIYDRRDDPAVAQALDLLRTLVGVQHREERPTGT